MCQTHEFRNVDIDVDVIRLALLSRPTNVIGNEFQMDLADWEAITFCFHKAVPSVLSDDLILVLVVAVRCHCYHLRLLGDVIASALSGS